MPSQRHRLTHDGRQVTLIGPTVIDERVWLAQEGNGNIVYLSRETIAAALGQVPTAYTAVTEDGLPAAPAAAPAEAPVAVAPEPEPERPTCPACSRTYTGELGTRHRCEGIRAVSCLRCQVVDTAALSDPPRAGFVCARCTAAGWIICKRCAQLKEQRGVEVCAQCNPLQPHDIWTQGVTAVGNDIMVLTRSHRPFAVEIESFRDPRHVEQALSSLPGWNKGSDPSIRPDPGCDDPTEWRSPPFRGDGGLAKMKADITRIRKGGYRSNDSCGLHVHVDMHDTTEDERRALHKFGLWAQEKGVFRFAAKSRARSRYCRPLTSFDADKADKYRWMSIQSYARHRTVEFRLHHGITKPELAVEWVKVCLRIVDRGLKLGALNNAPAETLTDLLGLTDYEKQFWLATAKKLHGRDVEVA